MSPSFVFSGVAYYLVGYYYLANPRLSGCNSAIHAFYYFDSNGNGVKLNDEYVSSLRDSRLADIAICACRSEQTTPPYPNSWGFKHPPRYGVGGINVLYGDGHVAEKMRSEVKPMWGNLAGANIIDAVGW